MQRKIIISLLGISIFVLTSGCIHKSLKTHNKYPDEIVSLKLDKEDVRLIEGNEPSLISEIVTFRKEHTEDKLEIQTVNDFIGLQKCENPFQCKYQDFPNNFQVILSFYQSITSNQFVWIQKKENVALKNILLKFLTNHAEDESAMSHAIDQLENMVNDPDYVKLIYESSIYLPKKDK